MKNRFISKKNKNKKLNFIGEIIHLFMTRKDKITIEEFLDLTPEEFKAKYGVVRMKSIKRIHKKLLRGL